MSFRYSTHERDRVLKLKQHMAMPVEVEMAKLGRHCFLTGLVALERKHK